MTHSAKQVVQHGSIGQEMLHLHSLQQPDNDHKQAPLTLQKKLTMHSLAVESRKVLL